MDINQGLGIEVVNNIRTIIIVLFLCFIAPRLFASDWGITPSLTIAELYTDNVNLATAGNEEGAFVTEISPGISIRRQTARNNLNLDYRMQNLYNVGGEEKIDMFHQLQFDSNSEILRNSLFLDLTSTIGQQNATDLVSANDNISGSADRTNVTTYGISPYWTPHFNGYVDGEVRFTYDALKTDNSSASDTDNFEYALRLNSGRRFSRVTWFVDYNNRDEQREDGDDVRFEELLTEVRGHINHYVNVFAQFGHSENEFASTTDSSSNGYFYSFGAQWKPSDRFNIEAAIGNNSHVTVGIKPFKRMNWVTTYRDNDIGTNSGSGVWQTRLDYRTKRTIWSASYVEDTTTTQSVVSDVESFQVTDEFGNVVLDPVTQQPVQSDIGLPTFVNDVFIRKRGEISIAYRTGKSEFKFGAFNEQRIFQASEIEDEVMGVNGSWNWSFTRRTSFFIKPAWQQNNREDSTNDRFDVATGVVRNIPVKLYRRGQLNAKLEYRYVNQSSDIELSEYTENRITASLLLTF